MTGISGANGGIAQILGQNGKNTGASRDSDSTSGIEAFGSFSLFSLQDSKVSGADQMSELASQSEDITGQLSDSIMSMLLELQETSTSTDGNSTFDAQQLFSDMDRDGDGILTRDEFMADAPDDVTEEMSENLWNIMAGSDSESMSEEDFVAHMAPPPAGGGADKAANNADNVLAAATAALENNENFDPLDTNEDGIVSLAELMAASGADEPQAAENDETGTRAPSSDNGLMS